MKSPLIFVLDSSSALKPILEEDGRDAVEKILYLKEKFQISLLMPEIFRYEFLNIVGRERNREVALEAYYAFIEKQVSIIPFERYLADKALKLVEKYPKISFYDACFHALAKIYNVNFVTSDRKYYQMTKDEGNIIMLEDVKL